MQGVLARFADASESCPRGLKYVNNPWQDRVIDAFRQIDTRWGYNGKPTKDAADNNGVPVTAAGDEAAYHYGGGRRSGSPDVHLVDMLVSHCGSTASLTWRVFTGEEPGFWTGVGQILRIGIRRSRNVDEQWAALPIAVTPPIVLNTSRRSSPRRSHSPAHSGDDPAG